MSVFRAALPARVRSWLRRVEGHARARRIDLGSTTEARLPPATFWPLLGRLTDGPTLLDVGSGTMAQLIRMSNRVRVGVEAHRPYLETRHDDPSIVPLHLDATRLEEVLLPKSFAIVTLVDVIEHFDTDTARAVLSTCESIAATRVVVFTPRGEFPQQEFDAYGLGGEEYQRHRSVWEPPDFHRLGYNTVVFAGFHGPGNQSFDAAFSDGAPPIDAILAWRNLGND